MAGIEKVCEYSGEYSGWVMYGFKFNQLQILPKFRKLFRGDGDTLYISKANMRWVSKMGYTYLYNEDAMNRYDPPFENEKDYIEFYKIAENCKLVQEYDYVYITKNKELLGNVRGFYFNHTLDLSTTKRKMKRLLRCKKLNVIEVDNVHLLKKGFQ